jgi:hypothetical protein
MSVATCTTKLSSSARISLPTCEGAWLAEADAEQPMLVSGGTSTKIPSLQAAIRWQGHRMAGTRLGQRYGLGFTLALNLGWDKHTTPIRSTAYARLSHVALLLLRSRSFFNTLAPALTRYP